MAEDTDEVSFFGDSRSKAEKFAEARGFDFFIYLGRLYVVDGGSRGLQCVDGFTIDGVAWEYGGVWSIRQATEEELTLWRALGGP